MTIKELRSYRQALGVYQKDIAEACRMHRAKYNRMEKGVYKPKDYDDKIRWAKDYLANVADQKIKEHKKQIKEYELMIKDLCR